jgi:lysophospholipase L1-like esterase
MKQHIFFFVFVIIIAFFLLLFQYSVKVPHFLKKKMKIACVGDSITYGSQIVNRIRNSYPSVLQELLGTNFLVRNFGKSGTTALMKDNFSYISTFEFNQSLKFLPDLVIIKLGTNDSKPRHWDNFSSDFEKDFIEIINIYKNLSSHPKIYICLPIWADQKNRFLIRGDVIRQEVIPKIKTIAQKTSTPILDFSFLFFQKSHLYVDGVHPNALGAKLLAKSIFEKISFSFESDFPFFAKSS